MADLPRVRQSRPSYSARETAGPTRKLRRHEQGLIRLTGGLWRTDVRGAMPSAAIRVRQSRRRGRHPHVARDRLRSEYLACAQRRRWAYAGGRASHFIFLQFRSNWLWIPHPAAGAIMTCCPSHLVLACPSPAPVAMKKGTVEQSAEMWPEVIGLKRGPPRPGPDIRDGTDTTQAVFTLAKQSPRLHSRFVKSAMLSRDNECVPSRLRETVHIHACKRVRIIAAQLDFCCLSCDR
jgi:hypothetical protein